MCGIVGFTGSTQAAPVLIEGLRRLEYRGYDSAGVAVHDGERIEMVKASGSVAHLAELTENGNALRGVCGIAHTRWATHGAPTDTNAHPHLSEHGLFAVIHNGIIENFAALRSELEAEGYINSIPGRGSFARPRGAVDSGRARELLRRFDEAVTELLYLGVTPEELCERISEGKEAAQA